MNKCYKHIGGFRVLNHFSYILMLLIWKTNFGFSKIYSTPNIKPIPLAKIVLK